jgi:hypothetical protein
MHVDANGFATSGNGQGASRETRCTRRASGAVGRCAGLERRNAIGVSECPLMTLSGPVVAPDLGT